MKRRQKMNPPLKPLSLIMLPLLGLYSDGIDVVSSSDVLIADSIISTADDAICLKTDDLGERGRGTIRPTENIVVNNCILTSSSAAMMIGTETHADKRHVLFSNIIVRNSNKVFGINVQDGATVSDVRFANITFETNEQERARTPFLLDPALGRV